MPSPWPQSRLSPPTPLALHFGYEKAGLTIDNQPIPWNAEAVLVHARVRLASRMRPVRKDFTLILGSSAISLAAEAIHAEDKSLRVEFRLQVPVRTQFAEIRWRGTSIGQVSLPMLREADFLQHLTVQMPTVGIVLGAQTVACQAYVGTQAKGAIASAVLSSATSLAPLVDLHPTLEVQVEDRAAPLRLPLSLNGKQLAARQALVSVAVPKAPLKHNWTAAWVVAGRVLAQHALQPVQRAYLARTLQLVGVRYLVEATDGSMQAARALPSAKACRRLGPCFILVSTEPGLAGWGKFDVRFVEVGGASRSIGTFDWLISDGPNPLAPGTLAGKDVEHGEAFELWCGTRCLGRLPLTAAPQATFTGEGAFQLAGEFAWSPAAEDQLQDRLGKLLG